MANLKSWIEAEAGNELIEGIVLGEMGWGDFGAELIPNYSEIPKGKLLTWDEAKEYVDYDFDNGFGAPRCQAVYTWTKNKVIAIGQYDGSTWCYSIPRNPCACMPTMEGGEWGK